MPQCTIQHNRETYEIKRYIERLTGYVTIVSQNFTLLQANDSQMSESCHMALLLAAAAINAAQAVRRNIVTT
jgi:hypothetical protein